MKQAHDVLSWVLFTHLANDLPVSRLSALKLNLQAQVHNQLFWFKLGCHVFINVSVLSVCSSLVRVLNAMVSTRSKRMARLACQTSKRHVKNVKRHVKRAAASHEGRCHGQVAGASAAEASCVLCTLSIPCHICKSVKDLVSDGESIALPRVEEGQTALPTFSPGRPQPAACPAVAWCCSP